MFYGLICLNIAITDIIVSYIVNTNNNIFLNLSIGVLSYIILNFLVVRIFKYFDTDIIDKGVIYSIYKDSYLMDVTLILISVTLGLVKMNIYLSIEFFLGLIAVIYFLKLWKYNIFLE